MSPQAVPIKVAEGDGVSGLWQSPAQSQAYLVLAHGAGAGMLHRSMAAIADGLEARGVATLRFQFPYMQNGRKRVDPPAICHAAVRAAVAEARRLAGSVPLFAGGKSFGGRMTSQAQALTPLDGVRGIVFFAFPLHTAGKPSEVRAEHLRAIDAPMLFLQGSRDTLAEPELLQHTLAGLGDRATLELVAEADHAFHVPAKTGRTDPEVLDAILDTAVKWMAAH